MTRTNSCAVGLLALVISFVVLAPHSTAHAQGLDSDTGYTGVLFALGVELGRAHPFSGGGDFSRNWFAISIGLPVATNEDDDTFSWVSLEFTFAANTNPVGDAGMRPFELGVEGEWFVLWTNRTLTLDVSLYGGLSVGMEMFSVGSETGTFLMLNVEGGTRIYLLYGLHIQIGFSLQLNPALSDGFSDTFSWRIPIMFGFRFP